MIGAGVDIALVGVLLGLVILEGGRRIPADAMVIRRVPFGTWRLVETASSGRWQIVSWLPPFTISLALPPAHQAGLDATALVSRLDIARGAAAWLVPLGIGTTLMLVLGLPLATALADLSGLIAALTLLLVLSFASATVGTCALRSLGLAPAQYRRRFLTWCWPFTSGLAVEGVFEAACRDAAPLHVLRQLLPAADFRGVIRPRAYDALVEGRVDQPLFDAVSHEEAEAILAEYPPQPDPTALTMCARCGATFMRNGDCPACRVPLRLLASSAMPTTVPVAIGTPSDNQAAC